MNYTTITTLQEFKKRYPIKPSESQNVLGSGSYGKVVRVEDQVETEWVAVKISEFKGDDSKSLKAEVELAQRVPRQANIARYEACYRLETDTGICDFAIMKYYPDGNLAMLMRNTPLTLSQKEDIVRGILMGLQHLHSHRIVHRDFKPANILISRDNRGRFVPKIADFGLSKLINEDEIESSDFDLSDGRGTPSYKAPEQIMGGKVSFNLDLWAFGVILYELFTGSKPFVSDTKTASEMVLKREIELKIVNVKLPDAIQTVPEPYQTLIRRCLVKDIHERARKEEELLDWLDGIPDLLKKAFDFLETGLYRQAIRQFDEVLTIRPGHRKALEGLRQARQKEADRLLAEADAHLARRDLTLATVSYESVLEFDPQNTRAHQGLATCQTVAEVNHPVPVTEMTDVYAQPEGTDLFEPSDKPVPPPTTELLIGTKSEVRESVLPPVTSPEVRQSRMRYFAVSVVAALVLGGYFLLNRKEPAAEQPRKTNVDTVKAPIVTENVKPGPVLLPPMSTKEPSEKEQQTAWFIDQTRKAIRQKNWAKAKNFVTKALRLDAADPQAKALYRHIAEQEQAQKQQDTENAAQQKQLYQADYEVLIGKGVAAIENENRKAEAISYFQQARQLASAHGLSTDDSNRPYSNYMNKADRIFEREDYEGAKAWYQVAQALQNTDEVRRKIQDCEKNL